MLVQLKFKNDLVPGYFISDEGKIYDSNGVEQEQYICNNYYFFKRHEVHKLMAHSFFGYKKGFDVHHKNQNKTDNRHQNLVYLTHGEHRKLHMIGKKFSNEHKAKIAAAHIGKKHTDQSKAKIRAAQHKKQVYCVQLDKVFQRRQNSS